MDVEQANLHENIDQEILVEISEGPGEFQDAVGELSQVIHGLVQAGRCWYMRLTGGLQAKCFHQCHTDPCLFCKTVDREVVAMWTACSSI